MISITNCKLICIEKFGYTLSIFNGFIIFWILLGAITFIYLFFVSAPYGRHIRKGWGRNISARAGWVVMESPCVLIMLIYAFIVKDDLESLHIIFLSLWLLHYVHRSFIYPFVIDMTNPKMPISIAVSAFFFNIVNVNLQAFGIYYLTDYSQDWMYSYIFFFGLFIFLIGMYINIKSDYLIVALRRDKGPGYHLPSKFMHKYISSPNYFGEIIEWLGWAILTWSISGAVFALWTIANLFPRALAHHKWYKEKFDNYPSNRKAIIPGII
jgi:3-oxo-5-alpha-steroid 4-dehydrogenase 1